MNTPAPRRPTVLPLGILPTAIPAVLIVAAALSETAHMWRWRYQEWPYTSAQFHEQPLTLVVPLAAAGAAHYAGRLTKSHRIFALPSSPRSGSRVAARHLSTLCTAFVGSYLLGMLPIVVLTAFEATAGGPGVFAVLLGLLAVATATTVGYLAGVLAGTAWIAPLMLVLGFVTIQLNAGTDLFLATVPVTHDIATLGEAPNTPVLTYRIAFVVLLASITMIMAARALRRVRRWKIPSVLSLGMVGLVVVMTVLPMGRTPTLYADAADPPRQCRTVNRVQYCVHQGHSEQLDAIISAASPLFDQYGRTPERAARVWDDALGRAPRSSHGTQYPAIPVRIHPINSVTTLIRNAQSRVAYRLAGMRACQRRYPHREPAGSSRAVLTSSHPADIATELAHWLLGRAESAAGLPPQSSTFPAFQGTGAHEVRRWIAEHEHRIATCALSSRP